MIRPWDIPRSRPAGLRLTSVDYGWYRIEDVPAAGWSWESFPQPWFRFDPATGQERVRYAARTLRGAVRERFHDEGRWITGSGAASHVVELRGRLRVLDLRQERILDLLHLDDEISVGRGTRVLRCGQELAARLPAWFGERCHGVVYRSRTTPQTSVNLAFFRWAPLQLRDAGPLSVRTALLAELVVDDGFRVDLPDWA